MKAMRPIFLVMTLFAPLCHANDFPTVARVEFVLECMRDHKGGEFELLNKCSCAVDRLAKKYKYDAFVEAETMSKSATIAGERGSTMRDNEEAQKAARSYRAAVADAGRACFLQ
jgi:hypothetical protein